jgi:hypothetical protein
VPILEDASPQDLKRLLELFPIANLRESWPDVKGTKEELCYAVAETKDLDKIKDFINQHLGCCKQHVYVFSRAADMAELPEALAGGPKVLDVGGAQVLYVVRSSYSVVLRDPLAEATLDFLWPIRVDLTDQHLILRIVVLEKTVSAYFDRPCYVADRSVDEKAILADVERIAPERADLHKGIKNLWENGFMDSPRTKYKKAISSASEAMDEERGIREHNPELFETLLSSTLLNTLFVIPQEKGSSVAALSVDPSSGYLAFTSYSTRKGDTDFVIHEILRHNQ